MKKRSKIHRTAAAFLLAAAVAAGSGTVFADPQEEADDGGWGNWGEEENDPTVSPEREPVTVGENADYALVYDAAGADIYVTDKRSGHVWSNTVTDVPEQNTAASHLLSQLLLFCKITGVGIAADQTLYIADKPALIRNGFQHGIVKRDVL